MSNPKNTNVADLGNALYTLTIGKIAPALGSATDLLLAPDGTLNVVPFSALVDDNQRVLIKHVHVHVPDVGPRSVAARDQEQGAGRRRDLRGPELRRDRRAGRPAGAASRGARSADFASLSWPQLPGTGQEADEVEKTLSGLTDYRGAKATETA